MKQILVFILLLLLPLCSPAAEPYHFLTLTTGNGLSSNTVKSMLIDSEGFLWIGTDTGLDRYDGYEVESFCGRLGEKWNFNSIDELQEDARKNVWIYSSYSYQVYNLATNRFIEDGRDYLKKLGIDTGEGSFSVKVDERGDLWVIEEGKLSNYDYANGSLESWSIHDLTVDGLNTGGCSASHDAILISNQHSVWHFNRSTAKYEQLPLPDLMQRKDDIIGTFIDDDRSVWIYSMMEEKVCRYMMGGKTMKEMIDFPMAKENESRNNAIRSLMDDGRGNVWIATDHKGIYICKKQTGEIMNISHSKASANSLSSNNVTALVKDRQGTVWAGHFKTGVSYSSANEHTFVNKGQQYGDISTMLYDRNGNLWIGTDGEGVYVEHKDGTYHKTRLPNITISSLVEDEDGSIWVGSYSEGLFHILPSGSYEVFCMKDGSLPANNVWYMTDDGKGRLWCGAANSQMFTFDKNTHKAKVVKGSSGEDIYCTGFCKDKNGNLLIPSTFGLVKWNVTTDANKRLTTNEKGTQRMRELILSACYDPHNDLMLLAHPQGYTIFDMMKDSLYYIANQMNGKYAAIKSMVQDRKGTFWMSTSLGIYCLSVKRNHDGSLSWKQMNYTSRESLLAPHFNSNSCVISPEGDVLLGGMDGYTVVNPDAISMISDQTTRLSIIGVTANDRIIDTKNGSIELNYDETYVKIRYFTGNLNNANSIRYAYKIEGRMNDWTYTEANHITLVGLSPGDYKLLVRLADSDDAENAKCELAIHVNSPFFLTNWAFLIYTFIACVIGYLFWKQNKDKQKQKLLVQKEDLERQKLVQITEMKLQFFTNISHDLRTPLTLIISPLDVIVKKLESGQMPPSLLSQLKNVRKNAQLLLSQVGSLLDFRRLDVGVETLKCSVSDIIAQLNSVCLSFFDYAHERNIKLQFESKEKSLLMNYDKEKMNKIIYNLLSNAFKFTQENGEVTVGFSHDNNNAVITVADTGKGISDNDKNNIFQRFYQSKRNESSQTGSGIGLHIVNEYVRMHGGSIVITDNSPQGSIFTITLPIVEAEEQALDLPAVADETEKTEKTKPMVLVVDDNADIVKFISANLQDEYEVLSAKDGLQAIEILESQQEVSLIISDVMMPGLDGFELCRRVKSDINTSHIPVILLTARTADDSKLEGLQLGADDYITKPFNMDVLLLRVKKMMEWAAKNHEVFKQKIDISPSEITITPLDEQFIQKAIKLVEDHISDSDYSVESLGGELGMSRSFLYKKLMAIAGVGPAEFIRTIRMKRGKALLEQSQMQVSEIAYAVGFNSLKSFTMNFKTQYGMTPTEYLKKKN